MGLPRIAYNGKSVDFPVPPYDIQIHPAAKRVTSMTLTGQFETIRVPRLDSLIRLNWRIIDSVTLRYALHNWWQWASQGNDWTLALDSAKVVDAKVTAVAAVGAAALVVNDPTGITNGQTYKLIHGPNQQLVTVGSVSASTVNLGSTLDFAVGPGGIFRDPFFFPGLIRDESAPSPIQDASAGTQVPGWPPSRFTLSLEFFEDIRTEIYMAGTYTPTLTNTTNIDASTAYVCQYLRVGNVVTVSGRVDVDSTAAAGTSSVMGMSLPIASDFASATNCGGTGGHDQSVFTAVELMTIQADATNNRALCIWSSQSTANHPIYFSFTYQVIG